MNSNEQPNTSMAVATVPPSEIQLTATAPDEIGQAQVSLIGWTKRKIEELKAEHNDLQDAHTHAVKQKWNPHALDRASKRALKRVEFYEKMLCALEHGYVIIPNFPVSIFAIRSDRKKPLKLLTKYRHDTHEQKAEGLPEGEGEYKNPFPQTLERSFPNPTPQEPNRNTYEFWADSWKDLEFPMTMAKPQIMEATTRAMAIKAFDDFGILPSAKHEDPIIVGRLRDPRSTTYNVRWVTFMVAWHLNTRDL